MAAASCFMRGLREEHCFGLKITLCFRRHTSNNAHTRKSNNARKAPQISGWKKPRLKQLSYFTGSRPTSYFPFHPVLTLLITDRTWRKTGRVEASIVATFNGIACTVVERIKNRADFLSFRFFYPTSARRWRKKGLGKMRGNGWGMRNGRKRCFFFKVLWGCNKDNYPSKTTSRWESFSIIFGITMELKQISTILFCIRWCNDSLIVRKENRIFKIKYEIFLLLDQTAGYNFFIRKLYLINLYKACSYSRSIFQIIIQWSIS